MPTLTVSQVKPSRLCRQRAMWAVLVTHVGGEVGGEGVGQVGAQGGQGALAGGSVLGSEAQASNHGEAAVLDLLGLELVQVALGLKGGVSRRAPRVGAAIRALLVPQMGCRSRASSGGAVSVAVSGGHRPHHAHGVEGAAGVDALLGLGRAAEGLGARHGRELNGRQGAQVEGHRGAKVGGRAALDQGQGGVVPVAVACREGRGR